MGRSRAEQERYLEQLNASDPYKVTPYTYRDTPIAPSAPIPIAIAPLQAIRPAAVKSPVESDADKAVRIRALGKSGNIKTSNRGDTSSALIGIRKLTGS